eukprot:TRINITY_DN6862_c0_g4_i1.p1 TRINITY_DN6862_c0_g4~~TRINITY_DN6862_c0_g4_i1.p1  ORF type:complete len:822 (-),score=104.76 TRINITY_DN6862_c0_g4_i1:162-2627(-)
MQSFKRIRKDSNDNRARNSGATPQRQTYGFIMDENLVEVLKPGDYLGGLLLSSSVMLKLRSIFLRKIHHAVFSIYAVTSIPFLFCFWIPVFRGSEYGLYVSGSLVILDQLIQILFAQKSILRMLFKCIETWYLLFHLLMESFSLCYMAGFTFKVGFFALIIVSIQINAILLDSFEKSFTTQRNALLGVSVLKRQFMKKYGGTVAEIDRRLESLGSSPQWNPNLLRDPNHLAADPNFIRNICILTDELNNLMRPSVAWPFNVRIRYLLQSKYQALGKADTAACLFALASKLIVYYFVAFEVIPVQKNASISLFGMEWFANDSFQMSCLTSMVVVFSKRLIMMWKHPFKIYNVVQESFMVPLLDNWSSFMEGETTSAYQQKVSMITRQSATTQSELQKFIPKLRTHSSTSHAPQQATGIMTVPELDDKPKSPRPFLELQQPKVVHFVPLLIFSSLGSGEFVDLSQTILSRYVKGRSLAIISRFIRRVSSPSTFLWVLSSFLLVVYVASMEDRLDEVLTITFAVSGFGASLFLSLYNSAMISHAISDFSTVYSFLNMVAMIIIWSIYAPFFYGHRVVIPISTGVICASAIFLDAHPIPFGKISAHLRKISLMSWKNSLLRYEYALACNICETLVKNIFISQKLTFQIRPLRQVSWMEHENSNEKRVYPRKPAMHFQRSGKFMKERGTSPWEVLNAKHNIGLRRPRLYIFGPLILIALYVMIENARIMKEEDMSIFFVSWSSVALFRLFTSNFVVFSLKKLFSIFQPFSTPSLSKPQYMIPLIDEIVDGSLFSLENESCHSISVKEPPREQGGERRLDSLQEIGE